MEWTDDMLETLRDMWPDPKNTCAVISAKIGCVSASAVAGKAHRLLLPPRPPAVKGDGPEMQARREATKQATIERRHEERAKKGLPPVIRRGGQKPGGHVAKIMPTVTPPPPPPSCSWPIGEPKTKAFRYCGAKLQPGRPYCPDHCKIAYVRAKDRREAA